MSPLDREERWKAIEALVEERDFSRLIGLAEDDILEVKSALSYDFADRDGRLEFAKDVSGLANSHGGWLLFGLTTASRTDDESDYIESLSLIPEDVFPVAELAGRLRNSLTKAIPGLTLEWVESKDTTDLGVGVIHVPREAVDNKPYLIQLVESAGRRDTVLAVGYAERRGDATEPLPQGQLVEAFERGFSPTERILHEVRDVMAQVIETQAALADTIDSLRTATPTDEPTAPPGLLTYYQSLYQNRLDGLTGES